MEGLYTTPFHKLHLGHGIKMVEFGGWEMPIQYPEGIVSEHLTTRRKAGLFDVSHMGRFIIAGDDALPFLQYVLTNNAAALEVGESHYTLIQNETGGALDDAYLYRFVEDSYLLVVNASNRRKAWVHFQSHAKQFKDVRLKDTTFDLAMVSLQGPDSKKILEELMTSGHLPEPARNVLSILYINDTKILTARTGYTGEPICFELFFDVDMAVDIWRLLIEKGASPSNIIVYNGSFITIFRTYRRSRKCSFLSRSQERVLHAKDTRSVCLAYLDSTIQVNDTLEIQVRKKMISGIVVPYHISSQAPPYVQPIPYDKTKLITPLSQPTEMMNKVAALLGKSIANTRWRQTECINLIPSEQSQSSMARLLTITDACGRYAEHKGMAAFSHADVFYYQGVDFIKEVEGLLEDELRKYFGCSHIESRLISGQMANTAVFSAMVDYLNRADRKAEPSRMRQVLNNHIIRGGHLSAQPMGSTQG